MNIHEQVVLVKAPLIGCEQEDKACPPVCYSVLGPEFEWSLPWATVSPAGWG